MGREEIQKDVCNIIQSIIGSNELIEIDDVISEVGITSTNLIKLILKLESSFGIEVEDEDMNFTTFRCISDIVDYIICRMEGTGIAYDK